MLVVHDTRNVRATLLAIVPPLPATLPATLPAMLPTMLLSLQCVHDTRNARATLLAIVLPLPATVPAIYTTHSFAFSSFTSRLPVTFVYPPRYQYVPHHVELAAVYFACSYLRGDITRRVTWMNWTRAVTWFCSCERPLQGTLFFALRDLKFSCYKACWFATR